MGNRTPKTKISAKNRLKVVNMFVPNSQQPRVEERLHKEVPYVYWDEDNLFPQRMVSLADNASLHRQLILTIAKYVAGEGLEFIGNNAEAAEEFWNEITEKPDKHLWRTAVDSAYYSGYSWQVIYQGDGAINKVRPLDFSMVRSSKLNIEDFDVNSYWVSRDWKVATDRKNFSGDSEIYRPIEIQTYDFDEGVGDKKQLLTVVSYSPDNTHYPKPDYMGCLRYVDLARNLQEYHDNQLKNSFMAGLHMHVSTDDEDDIDGLEADINAKFSGATNTGKLFLTVGNSQEAPAVINEIPSLKDTDLIQLIREGMNEEIVNAHGMPPILAGLQVDTGLGGAGLAIKEAQENFQNTKIKPKQKQITENIEQILKDSGFTDVEVRIKQLEPIDFDQSDSIKLSTRTVNELREEAGLEEIGDERGDMMGVNTQDIDRSANTED